MLDRLIEKLKGRRRELDYLTMYQEARGGGSALQQCIEDQARVARGEGFSIGEIAAAAGSCGRGRASGDHLGGHEGTS